MKLKSRLARNRKVYTVTTEVSRNGARRNIAVLLSTRKGVINISNAVSDALGWKWADNNSVIVGGMGMHMGHYLVRKLSEALFNDDQFLQSVSL